jgi:hypothetical protein
MQTAWIKRMFRWAAEEELISGQKAFDLWSVKGVRRGTTVTANPSQ